MLSVAPKTVKRFSWPVVSSGHFFLMLFVAFSGTVNAAVYDLSSDWSNSNNPNGPWSYNQGSTPLPSVPNFNFGNTGWASSCNQPAWAPSNATGGYLPAFLKVDACVTTTENTEYPLANVVAGDVWVHTVDGSNGNPSLGPANVLFTLPASGGAGAYTISGSLWNSLSSSTTSSSRPQDWSLFLNGVQVATGVLSGNVFRSQAQKFSVVENLNVGDQVKLQIVKDPAAPAGFIVSINLTISELSPPAITAILPQLAFGGGWYTALYFTNLTSTPVSFIVSFIGDDGNPLTVPALTGSSVTVNLAARGTALIEIPNTGPLVQGYVSAPLPAGVTGYGVFRASNPGVNDQEAVVPLSGTTATTSTLLFDDTKYITGIAVVNLASVSTTISVFARDNHGNTIGTSSISLAANAKTAVVLRDLPGLGGIAGALGSVDFTASIGNLAALGLRFNGLAFTSIPTSDR